MGGGLSSLQPCGEAPPPPPPRSPGVPTPMAPTLSPVLSVSGVLWDRCWHQAFFKRTVPPSPLPNLCVVQAIRPGVIVPIWPKGHVLYLYNWLGMLKLKSLAVVCVISTHFKPYYHMTSKHVAIEQTLMFTPLSELPPPPPTGTIMFWGLGAALTRVPQGAADSSLRLSQNLGLPSSGLFHKRIPCPQTNRAKNLQRRCTTITGVLVPLVFRGFLLHEEGGWVVSCGELSLHTAYAVH